MPEITITAKEDGTLQTEAQGFKGKACLTETLKILRNLNAKQTSQRLKSEYNQVGVMERVAER